MLQLRLVDQTWTTVANQEPHVLRQHPPFPRRQYAAMGVLKSWYE
jgi:hypothetical protein